MAKVVKLNNSKRVQVDKDKTNIFIIVAVASVVGIACLMTSKSFYSKGSYLSKVAEKKESAVTQLEKNTSALSSLKESYTIFKDKNPNLIGGLATGTGDRDGNNVKLILDALPNKYDFPALTSSIEQLLVGYKVNGITGTDDIITQQSSSASAPVEIPFTVDVGTDYKEFKVLLDKLDKSIRPFSINQLELRGSNSLLQTSMQLKTYYQPEKGLEIKTEEVQ